MSLEAIQTVTRVERESQEKLAAAGAEARQIVAEARREGEALLLRTREHAAEEGKALMKGAEERAARKAEEISREAEQESAALRKEAETHLEAAAEFIVGRVVKH